MSLWQAITYLFRRGPRRPMSFRQPARDTADEIPLGMEAIDMKMVRDVNRRNASLERVSTFFSPKKRAGSFLENAESSVTSLPDDETYAARYHRAYIDKGTSRR